MTINAAKFRGISLVLYVLLWQAASSAKLIINAREGDTSPSINFNETGFHSREIRK